MTWKPDVCVYHGGCDDGFAAAFVVRRKWPDVSLVPGSYGSNLDLKQFRGQNVLFVDFSLKLDAMAALGLVAKSVVVLDHHKTAEAELKQWNVGGVLSGTLSLDSTEELLLQKKMSTSVPVLAFFDMEFSGAVMAWQYCFGLERNKMPPTFLAYIQDRDLWRFAFGDQTRKVSAAVRSYPQEFAVWQKFFENPDMFVAEGEIILRAHMKNVREFAAQAYMDKIGGHLVPVANVPYHYASDVAHELLRLHPDAHFAASFYRRKDGRFSASLRSEDSRLDVSEIAKKYGGGGHRNAAGFEVGSMGGASK